MTRTRIATLLGVAVVIGACGGGTTPTAPPVATTPGAAATTPAAAATTPAAAATTPAAAATTPAAAATTPAGQVSPPPQGGSGTVVATLTGGSAPGTFTGSGNPNCSYGFLGANTWGVSFTPNAGDQIQNVVLTAQPGANPDEWAFTANVSTDPTGAVVYVVSNMAGPGPTIVVTDNGTTATLHVVGSTITGNGTVDLTINCPSVIRV
jgi:hypothetical protein